MRLTTGVSGFDEMVQGGLPAGASIVLQGPAGQEKVRFALTFLAEGLKAGASGLILVSSQSPDSVLAELRNLGVDLDAVVRENRLRIVDWYSQREEPVQDVEERGIVFRSSIDLTNVGVALSRAIAALGGDKPKRAVVELLSPAMSVYEVSQVYAFAQSSKGKFVRFNFTALFLVEKDMHTASDLSTLHQPFDGVVEIDRTRVGDKIVRKLGVLHMKDTAPDSAFRILEITEQGLRVVREPVTPAPSAPASGEAAVREAPLGAQLKSVQAAEKSAAEKLEEPPTRAYLIMQIARERLKLNPGDADALFAMAAAQATLDDVRGALESLDRLSKLDDRYPGLWVLKTKLHARLGETDRARASRVRAEQNKDIEGLPQEIMVPCPLCETPISERATRCTKCGARFLTETDMTGELEALGQAAIQEKVRADLGGDELLAPGLQRPSPKPGKKIPARPAAKAVVPSKKAERPSARQGLTNGLVRERASKVRPVGMTNGLRGRTNGLTNGLRGRTNGLTNGLRGRTNGLTNGLGRTNGLTNGLRGRTNGLTNGLGRTNGVTNGLTNGLVSLRRGITNGLTNGNGFTNGLGSPRFHREVRLNRWKLYVIPMVAMALLLVPLFTPPEYAGRLYPIQIDGQFNDWANVVRLDVPSPPALDPDIDIVRVAVKDNIDFLAFYIEVRGNALAGDSSSSRITDDFFIFLDTDRLPSTGYQVQGLGADRLIEILGWGGQVAGATLKEFDANRDPRDWSGWIKGTPVAAAVTGNRIEFQADWTGIVDPKAPIEIAFASKGWDGQIDAADIASTNSDVYVVVSQDTAAPQIVSGSLSSLASFTFRAVGGDVRIASINVTLQGTFTAASLSSLALLDDSGVPLSQKLFVGAKVQFDLAPLVVPRDASTTLSLRPEVARNEGSTIGAFLLNPRDVVVESGGVVLVAPPSAPASLAYVGSIPANSTIDGGFAEWSNVTADPVGDAQPAWSRDVDISAYGFQGSAGSAYFMVRTVGVALNGTLIPRNNSPAGGNASAPPDSDRDGVPDAVDLYPYDFNNDGTPDSQTNGDYDQDGITDYGFTGGTDYSLNTTIPANFPAPYGGRFVSVYIGPVQRPVAKGEDTARFFLDQDGSAGTGYAIDGIGADYLVEVTGKGGQILTVEAEQFAGASPGEWSWNVMGPSVAAKDLSRLEVAASGIAVTNASRASFEIRGWSASRDNVAPSAPARTFFSATTLQASSATDGYPPGTTTLGKDQVVTLDISGNQKWFFTNGATTGTGCTSNFAASTTAGASATSTTLSDPANSICWFTPTNPPDTEAGPWEVILDIDKASDGTKVLRPSGNGDVNDWTASGCTEANEYQCVADNPNDGDTTYIVSTSNLVTFDSLFNIFDWSGSSGEPPSPLTVVNVQVTASCRKIAAPGVSVKVMVKSGVTTSVGSTSTDCANSATYTVWSDTWTTDPADGAAWTLADINALQVGVRDADGFIREVHVSHVMATVTFVPAYTVQIDKCTVTDCSTYSTLYGPTNGNTYGSDVTFTTPSIATQTFTGNDRIRFLVKLNGTGTSQNHGSVTVRYNGANPGTDDSRGTVRIPEFEEIAIPITGSLLLVPVIRWWQARRGRREDRTSGSPG